jgi:5-methylcytosine-specific restriction endonuclease McrA
VAKHFKYHAGLGKPISMVNTVRSRGGTWTRIARNHKAVHMQCAKCGAVANLETDHIVPLHLGGTNEWRNLQSLCQSCHSIKSLTDGSR